MNSKHLIMAAVAALAACAQAQVVTEGAKVEGNDPALLDFKARVAKANPDLEVVGVQAEIVKTAILAPRLEPRPQPLVAIFVKNQTTVKPLDDQVDAIRDSIAAALAAVDMEVIDPHESMSNFDRYKTTIAEERLGLIEGAYRGGSPQNQARMLGADFAIVVSITDAKFDKEFNTYSIRVSTKAMDVLGVTKKLGANTANWRKIDPVAGDFADVIDKWLREVPKDISVNAPQWKRPDVNAVAVEFSVSTTIDAFINGLENGVRAPNELLDEMRRVIGGVTVSIDGATIGSSPGTFKALPGPHQLRIERQWMEPWQKPVFITEGAKFNVGLELSTVGQQKFKDLEGFRAGTAVAYAEAMWRKGIRVNFDTAQWRDVGNRTGNEIINVNQNR
ncbi:MAG: PEGA domain-containing protein [Kiritimatiellaeota bacterium]|nr:PEGA domain-containing protein [Kiritimatiellota bacterium]